MVEGFPVCRERSRMSQNSETDSSLDFAKDCGYITPAQHEETADAWRQIGRMIAGILAKPQSFLIAGR